MKANRQRLLTTISVVVDCWDRAKTHKDFAEQVGVHIEDLRDIVQSERSGRLENRLVASSHFQNVARRARMETLYKKGQSIVQEFRKGVSK